MRRRAAWSMLSISALLLGSTATADINVRRAPQLLRAPAAAAVHRDSGRLPLLIKLKPGQTAASLDALEVAPGFAALHLPPTKIDGYLAAHPSAGVFFGPPRRPLINYSGRWTRVPVYRGKTGHDGSGVVVGIIDTGIDAAHPDFRDADGRSRIAWMIKRGQPRGVHAALETQYGCNDANQSPCAIFNAADLDDLLLNNPAGVPRDADGHGTHVASIAAGNGGPSAVPKPAYVGMAPGATLVIASPSEGGGFSDPDILNAARFIFERAATMGLPAVVNVSLGSDFGPHDGTSALESGLAALVRNVPGRAMVVAAGNSGTLYNIDEFGPFGVHTEAHVSDSAVTRVPMLVPGAKGKVTGSGFVWVYYEPGDAISVGLEGPDGEWIGLTGQGEDNGYDSDGDRAAVVNNLVNGNTSLTEDTNGAVVFWEASWEADQEFAVLLRGRGHAKLWVTGTGGAAAGSSLGLLFQRALKAGTVAVPASHPDLLAVGCTLNRNSWSPNGSLQTLELNNFGGMDNPLEDSTCYFSAAGPNASGATKPDLLAPGAFVAGAMSADADPTINPDSIFNQPGCPDPPNPCYVVDDRHALTSGTSMAAPHVAGAIALLLQRDPSLTQLQIREILQAGAARPTGFVPYDFQQGPGSLNMQGALQVLEETMGSDPEPDLAASYFVLSSPFLRPDPEALVEGTLELRHADGTVAMGVTAADLQLEARGGLVARPLTWVRAGLWRFAVAAPAGSGGTTARVDVRYRGQSLGSRELPIGVDAWAAGSGVNAVGGCSSGRRPGAPGERGGGGWLLGLLLGVSVLCRRRT